MGDRQGTPVWYELLSDDPDAAEAFYARVAGWRFARPPGGLQRDYRTFAAADGEDIGGVLGRPDGATFGPLWLVYFGVDDVDAATARLTSLGGSVDIEPTDIPGVGRFSFVADPQGARFYLMRVDGDGSGAAYAPTKPGHCSWNELVTTDQKAALEFYSALLGWERIGSMPMGAMGDYTFVACGDTRIGAMMDAADASVTPCWNFAFTVPEIDAAKAAVEAGGGTVRLGPLELPEDGGWLIQCDDPRGGKVMFSAARPGR